MKLKILILNFAIPIILAVLLFLTIYFKEGAFEIFLTTTFLVAYVAGDLLTEKRYFRSLNVTGTNLEISYYTRFLKLKTLQIPISEVNETKLYPAAWYSTFPSLRIKGEGQLLTFQVFNRHSLSLIQSELGSHNLQYK